MEFVLPPHGTSSREAANETAQIPSDRKNSNSLRSLTAASPGRDGIFPIENHSMKISFDSHRPVHYYIDDATYFLTGHMNEGCDLLFNEERKQLFFDVLLNILDDYSIELIAWVILINHYHIMFQLKKGIDLGAFENRLHSVTATLLNRLDNAIGRNVWYQYWDYCPKNEKDYYTHFNYIHHNPVKHHICKNQKQVEDYKFCTYKEWVDKMGEEWMLSCFEQYPIIDYTIHEYE